MPGLRPPNHVDPQPPVRILVPGIHPSPSLVPDPQIPQLRRHPGDLVVGRGAVAVAVDGDHAADSGEPLSGDPVPRGADAGGLADLPYQLGDVPLSGAMRAAIAEPSASTGNTARSLREPCPWRAVVSLRSWRDVTLTNCPGDDASSHLRRRRTRPAAVGQPIYSSETRSPGTRMLALAAPVGAWRYPGHVTDGDGGAGMGRARSAVTCGSRLHDATGGDAHKCHSVCTGTDTGHSIFTSV